MSGIARYLQQLGHKVVGSDVRETSTTAALRSEGIVVEIGHRASNVHPKIDLVVYSTAVPQDNVELVAAQSYGIPVVHRSSAMQLIVASKPAAAVVSGTHGKTSTASMLTGILRSAGHHPSFFIGGTPAALGTNALFDVDGKWIVVEGDESDRSFLAFDRSAVLVTNIEADHLEHWDNSFARLVQGFESFVDGCSGPIVLCHDDITTRSVAAARSQARTYGFDAEAQYRLISYRSESSGVRLVMEAPHGEQVEVQLRQRGRDMATNALGAATLAHQLGLAWPAAVIGLESFRGVARRFEHRGSCNGVDLVDDYAHTATEIATTLARAREGSWNRVIAVCQPHRYTRIAAHGHEYGEALRSADLVVVTALDPAFEAPIEGIDASIVVDSVRKAAPNGVVEFIEQLDDLADLPWRLGRPGDVIVTLGCGTITDAHALWALEARKYED